MAPTNNDENYNFCNEMDDYITNNTWIETLWPNQQYKSMCVFTEAEFPQNRILHETICAKFKCLFDLLFNESFGFSSMFKEPDVYINFWINYQLKNINSSITPQRFYEVIKSDTSFDTHEILKGKIQNIQNEHLENMTTFYNLYHKYNTIKSIIQDNTPDYTQCTLYSNESVEKYEESLTRCPKGTTNSFCEALKVFKEKYEKLNDLTSADNCKIKVLKPFPSHESPPSREPPQSRQTDHEELPIFTKEQGGNTDYSSAAAASATMVGMLFISLILYKSTPFGPWLRNRVLQKNMIGKNIEEDEKNHELLLHMSEYQDINSEDSIYKIPYTSL